MSRIINLNIIRRGKTTKWEWIARRLLILSSWGYSTDYFRDHIDDPDFLTIDWLESYYGEPLTMTTKIELDEVDKIT